MRKKKLKGGTLRLVAANEIKRVLANYGSEGTSSAIERAALDLGCTSRALRIWLGPVEKGGWEELQVSPAEAMDKLYKTPMKKKKKAAKKPKRLFE